MTPTGLCSRVLPRDQQADRNRQVARLAKRKAHPGRPVVQIGGHLLRDPTEALDGSCTRLYGLRPVSNRVENALQCAEHRVGPMVITQQQRSASQSRAKRRTPAPFGWLPVPNSAVHPWPFLSSLALYALFINFAIYDSVTISKR